MTERAVVRTKLVCHCNNGECKRQFEIYASQDSIKLNQSVQVLFPGTPELSMPTSVHQAARNVQADPAALPCTWWPVCNADTRVLHDAVQVSRGATTTTRSHFSLKQWQYCRDRPRTA